MAALVGITQEALQAMKNWMGVQRRPDTIPMKLQGIIPVWSRELGNAEPRLIAANLTQASKLYAYARIKGLSQLETESCFEHAREAVSKRRGIEKKMAFFFSSLKLDILAALQMNALTTSRQAATPSLPDGYDNEPPTNTFQTSVRARPAVVVAPKPEPEPEPVLPAIEPIVLPPDSPRPEWKSWQTADWWGEQLRDELDPGRTFSRYDVRPTEGGCYGFVFSLKPPGDPVWEEILAGEYITCAMVRQSIKAIRTVREPFKDQRRYGH